MPTILAIDTRGLTEAVRVAQQYAETVPAITVGRAGYFIAKAAKRDVRRSSVGEIDSKLGVSSSLAVRVRGPLKGQPTKRRKFVVAMPQTYQTMAMGIILLRMWAGSRQNVRENSRFLIDRMSLSPGQGVRGFWNAVRAAALGMVGQRHKSIAFIASSMVAVVHDLEPYCPPKYRRGAASDPESDQAAKYADTPKGRATVTTGVNQAVMTGQALIGVGGVPDNLNEQHNEAMWRWLAPAIQLAVYQEENGLLLKSTAQAELEERRAKFAANGVVLS